MNIKQLFIKTYGPIKDKDYEFKPGFNLLYGPNERGKSLTFDALVKLLLGKTSKKFEAINRVDDEPGQYGSFVGLDKPNADKKLIKLQGKTTLTDLTGLTASECQNLFLIRNSNLSISQDLSNQDQFLTNLTDRLTGLKTAVISELKQALRDTNHLTDKTDKFANTKDSQQLATRMDLADTLTQPTGKLTQLVAQDKKLHWSELEAAALSASYQLKNVELELEQLETAKKIQEANSIKTSLTQAKTLKQELTNLKEINQDKLDRLKQNQTRITTLKENEQELKKEVKQKEQQLKLTKKELTKTEKALSKASQPHQQVATEYQPALNQLQSQLAQTRSEQNQKTWQIGLLGSSGLLILSLLAYMLQPAGLIIGLVIIFSLATVTTAVKYFLQIQQQQQIKTNFEELKLGLAQYGIEGKKIEQLLQQLQKFSNQFQALQQTKLRLSIEVKQVQEDLSELKDRKQRQLTSKINQLKQELVVILDEAAVKKIAEFAIKLKKKNETNTKYQQQVALLTEKLGKPTGWRVDEFIFWQQELVKRFPNQNSLKNKTTQSIQINYRPEKVEQLKQLRLDLSNQLDQQKQQLTQFKEQTKELERLINQILIERTEPMLCESMADLRQAQNEIIEFIHSHQQRRQDVIATINILNLIQRQEKQKVGELFGLDSTISRQFKQITGNRYAQVFFDQDENCLKVETAEGKFLNPEQLSAGTYDQLYFAIRLGLGQKLLSDEPGFFIMDDPFIKADEARLHQQLDMLLDLTQQGWQIIYFSAKKEVENYLIDKADQIIEVKA